MFHNFLNFVFQQLIGLFRCARSGSTLLCQVLNKLPNTLVLADPFIYGHATKSYLNGHISRSEAIMLMKSTVKLQAKPFKKVCFKYKAHN